MLRRDGQLRETYYREAVINRPHTYDTSVREVLPRYIRNSKAIRSWEGSKMRGFAPETFSDEDVANIVAYLKEMAVEKPNTD